jgi:hypothetical protein
MENKKDIGKAFKEKLNSLDRVPGDHVWIGISDAIEKDKKGKNGLFFFWGATLFLLVIGAIAILNQYDQNDGLGINTQKNAKENTIINNSKAKTTNNGVGDVINSKNKSNETTADKNSETSTNRSNATTANKNDLLKNKKATISKIRSNTKNNIGKLNATKQAKLTNSTTENGSSSSSQKSNRTKFASTSGKNKMNSLSELKNKSIERIKLDCCQSRCNPNRGKSC